MATENSANRVRISYRRGDTGPFQVLTYTSDSFTATPEALQSNSIRHDRKSGGQKVVGLEASGTLEFEMAPGVYDDFLELALAGSWETDTPSAGNDQLSIGVSDERIQLCKSFLDLDSHVLFKDVAVQQMELTMGAGEAVTASIEMVGEQVDADFDVTSETFTEAADAIWFDSATNVSSLQIDGSPVNGCITSLGLTVANGYEGNGCVGNLTKRQVIGQSTVTSSKTLRMTGQALDLWRGSLTNTPISSSFTMGGDGSSYTFDIGKEYLSGELPGGETSGVLSIGLEGTAAVDAEGETLVITRTTA